MLKMGRLTEPVKRPNATLWKYKAINGCYYNSPSACADKCGRYEDIDEDPEHFAEMKKAFDILKSEFHLEMSVDEDVGCLFLRLSKEHTCIVGWVKGAEKINALKTLLTTYEERPCQFTEDDMKTFIKKFFNKTTVVWKPQ